MKLTALLLALDVILILVLQPFYSIRVVAYSFLALANILCYIIQLLYFFILYRKNSLSRFGATLHFVSIQFFAFATLFLFKLTEVLMLRG